MLIKFLKVSKMYVKIYVLIIWRLVGKTKTVESFLAGYKLEHVCSFASRIMYLIARRAFHLKESLTDINNHRISMKILPRNIGRQIAFASLKSTIIICENLKILLTAQKNNNH